MIDASLLDILAATISISIPGVSSAYAMQRIGELSESLLESEEKGFFTTSLVFSVLAETPTIYGLLVALIILISTGATVSEDQALVAILASFAVAVPGAAAAYAIGLVSQAALVAVKQNRKLFGKTLVFAALPEAIAIYGLIVALLFLSGAGIVGDKVPSNIDVGKIALATAITAISGLVAIFIGRVAVSGIKSLAKDERTFGQSLVIAVLPESIALYILITVLLILTNSGFI